MPGAHSVHGPLLSDTTPYNKMNFITIIFIDYTNVKLLTAGGAAWIQATPDLSAVQYGRKPRPLGHARDRGLMATRVPPSREGSIQLEPGVRKLCPMVSIDSYYLIRECDSAPHQDGT